MRLFVGCSSRDDIPSKYYDECKNLLDKLFEKDYDLVFGACNKGLMGLSYNAAISNDSDILGIYPKAYEEEAKGLLGVMEPVNTVSDRTDMIIRESDILLFLPGGIGTVYELFTAIESKRAMEHNKPIIVYSVDGFYDELFCQLDKMCDENFVSKEDFRNYHILYTVDSVIRCVEGYAKPLRELSRKRGY